MKELPCAPAALPVKDSLLGQNPQISRGFDCKNNECGIWPGVRPFRFTLKSCAISATSAAANSPKGRISRARVSCGRAARIVLSRPVRPRAGRRCAHHLPSLHPGAVPGGNVLDAQLVGSRQQGGKTCSVPLAQNVGVLPGQCFGVQHDALDAKSLCCLFGLRPRRSVLRPAARQRPPRQSPAAAKCAQLRRISLPSICTRTLS